MKMQKKQIVRAVIISFIINILFIVYYITKFSSFHFWFVAVVGFAVALLVFYRLNQRQKGRSHFLLFLMVMLVVPVAIVVPVSIAGYFVNETYYHFARQVLRQPATMPTLADSISVTETAKYKGVQVYGFYDAFPAVNCRKYLVRNKTMRLQLPTATRQRDVKTVTPLMAVNAADSSGFSLWAVNVSDFRDWHRQQQPNGRVYAYVMRNVPINIRKLVEYTGENDYRATAKHCTPAVGYMVVRLGPPPTPPPSAQVIYRHFALWFSVLLLVVGGLTYLVLTKTRERPLKKFSE